MVLLFGIYYFIQLQGSVQAHWEDLFQRHDYDPVSIETDTFAWKVDYRSVCRMGVSLFSAIPVNFYNKYCFHSPFTARGCCGSERQTFLLLRFGTPLHGGSALLTDAQGTLAICSFEKVLLWLDVLNMLCRRFAHDLAKLQLNMTNFRVWRRTYVWKAVTFAEGSTTLHQFRKLNFILRCALNRFLRWMGFGCVWLIHGSMKVIQKRVQSNTFAHAWKLEYFG